MVRLFVSFVVAIGYCSSSSFCDADEYLTSKSPDGKFALHVSRGDKQPFSQSCEIVDSKAIRNTPISNLNYRDTDARLLFAV